MDGWTEQIKLDGNGQLNPVRLERKMGRYKNEARLD